MQNMIVGGLHDVDELACHQAAATYHRNRAAMSIMHVSLYCLTA
jgi:hypothetical protein